MREVRIRYNAASVLNSDLATMLKVFSKITMKASLYQEGQGDWIRQVYEVVMLEGKEVEDIDDIPFMELEDLLHSRQENGYQVHAIMVKNTHPLGRIGLMIDDAVVMPGSEIGIQGAVLMIRGAPAGVRRMVAGFRTWKEPAKISVIDSGAEQFDDISDICSEHQAKVFLAAHDSGHYDSPRKVSLVELSKQLGLSRSTVAGHLRVIERNMAESFARRLREQ